MSKPLDGSFGNMFHFQFQGWDPERSAFLMQATVNSTMTNPFGTTPGGVCAAIVDEAMGTIAFCMGENNGIMPTVHLNITYHRPVPADTVLMLRIRPVSNTRTLVHMMAEAYVPSDPNRICFSASGTFFRK